MEAFCSCNNYKILIFLFLKLINILYKKVKERHCLINFKLCIDHDTLQSSKLRKVKQKCLRYSLILRLGTSKSQETVGQK